MIESYGPVMYIYQSWHGKHALGHVLDEKGPTAWSPAGLLPLLLKTLSSDKEMAASRAVFYHNLLHPSADVTFTLNEHPLAPEATLARIKESVQQFSSQWELALSDPRPVKDLQADTSGDVQDAEEKRRLLEEHSKAAQIVVPSHVKVQRACDSLFAQANLFRQEFPPPTPETIITWSDLKAYIDKKHMQNLYANLTAEELKQVLKILAEEWFVLRYD